MKIKFIFVVVLIAVAAIAAFLWRGRTERPETKNSQMLSDESALAVTAEMVQYFGTVSGYFASPQPSGNYPGIVMIHEWWGLNGNIKDMARELAQKGYLVLAVDLHKGEVAATPERARELVSQLDKAEAAQNLRAAVSFLREKKATKIASLGWCFGGGQSLALALSGEKLDATVIYYGTLITDKTQLQRIQWPVLGIFGAEDTSIPVATVYDFRDALTFLDIPGSVHVYPGVGHAFANPSGPNYAPAATKDAWEKTLRFLGEHLKGALLFNDEMEEGIL
ncbi:MAG: dienelactone hydrolase family protein [Candidatus Sungbacteria bacterium]|uniref:Dienelactone hydrolase family protein n=1 Tax=Candidatus Sungiibacteriota bacterium TaxID=2750080 RepID=A0A932YW65_9BACT|nr:dienelactone hydrolase family protein [Candidatus Sungbacteria bacterium]